MLDIIDRPETAIPSADDSRLAQEASRTLARKAADTELKVKLEDGSELVLPKAATRLLGYILTEMSQGNAVTIIPLHAELTTQEAADLLHISRPHLIKLLTAKKLPFHMAGSHRRIKFNDLRAYENEVEKTRREAMQELANQAQDLGFGY